MESSKVVEHGDFTVSAEEWPEMLEGIMEFPVKAQIGSYGVAKMKSFDKLDALGG